jgi:hypothetical protein
MRLATVLLTFIVLSLFISTGPAAYVKRAKLGNDTVFVGAGIYTE